jgi:hypothetical protein
VYAGAHQVLVLSDHVITQARQLLQAFRREVIFSFGDVEYGTGSSVRWTASSALHEMNTQKTTYNGPDGWSTS